jgi:hypothetical protein
LNWKYHHTFCAVLNRILIDTARWAGAEIIILDGTYWELSVNPPEPDPNTCNSRAPGDTTPFEPFQCNPFFTGSLMIWRKGKMAQDQYKEQIDKLGRLPKTEETTAALAEAKSEYSEVTRFIDKLLSNSLLGKFAQRLKESTTIGACGAAQISDVLDKMLEEKRDAIAVHHLVEGDNPEGTRLSVKGKFYPYNGPAIITVSVDPRDKFEGGACHGVKECIVSSAMLAWSHTHMTMALLMNTWASKSIRAVETDGAHFNNKLYEAYMCDELHAENPYWRDGPIRIRRAQPPANYTSYALGEGDVVVAAHQSIVYSGCQRIGDLRVNQYFRGKYLGARQFQSNLEYPPSEYGFFTFDDFEPSLCEVIYPFCKFYRYAILKNGVPDTVVTRSKGIGWLTKNGEQLVKRECQYPEEERVAHARLCLSLHRSSLTEEEELLFQQGLRDERHEESDALFNAAPTLMELKPSKTDIDDPEQVALSRAVFDKLCTGYGVDAMEWRFEGALSVSSASRLFEDEDEEFGHETDKSPTSSIIHRFATKRIAPHPFYRLVARDAQKQALADYESLTESLPITAGYDPETTEFIAFGGERITPEMLDQVLSMVEEIFGEDAETKAFDKRGVTISSTLSFETGPHAGDPKNLYLDRRVMSYINRYSSAIKACIPADARKTKIRRETTASP